MHGTKPFVGPALRLSFSHGPQKVRLTLSEDSNHNARPFAFELMCMDIHGHCHALSKCVEMRKWEEKCCLLPATQAAAVSILLAATLLGGFTYRAHNSLPRCLKEESLSHLSGCGCKLPLLLLMTHHFLSLCIAMSLCISALE